MPAKIKGFKKLDKKLKKMIPDARTKWAKEMKATIVDIIVEKITSGSSPVAGKNQYKQYSKKYGEKKGRRKPVDLVGSGDMLNNMRAIITRKKDVRIEFPSNKENKKASYHQYGRGKMPLRRILPTSRENFKVDIMRKVLQAIRKAIKDSIK